MANEAWQLLPQVGEVLLDVPVLPAVPLIIIHLQILLIVVSDVHVRQVKTPLFVSQIGQQVRLVVQGHQLHITLGLYHFLLQLEQCEQVALVGAQQPLSRLRCEKWRTKGKKCKSRELT